MIRWETPVAILPRLCLPGTQLEGETIAPESQVLFAIAGANRDPEVFDDPDTFDPSRAGEDEPSSLSSTGEPNCGEEQREGGEDEYRLQHRTAFF